MATKKVEKVEKLNKNGTITGLELQWEILLVYLIGILGLIFAFMKEEKVSKDARFHYKQAGALFIITLGITIVYRIITAIFALLFIAIGLFPVISIVLGTLYGVFSLGVLALIIVVIIKGFQGENFKIPVVSKMAESIWKD